MSVGSNVVKITAKTALKGNYIKVAVASLVLILSWLLCINSTVLLQNIVGGFCSAVIFALIFVFLLAPLALGLLRYIWRILLGVADNPVAVFYWFSNKKLYIRSEKFVFQYVFRVLIWLAILNIPSILLYILSQSYTFELFNTSAPIWTANLGYYSIGLRNISFVLVFFLMLKFYMAPLLFVADDNIDINEAMYNSSVISRKSSIDFISLIASSIGWILLSFFCLPLPFTLPLLMTFYAVHIRFTVFEYNRHIEESKIEYEGFI